MESDGVDELTVDKNALEKTREALLQVAPWFCGSCAILLAIGYSWRALDDVVEEVRNSPLTFVVIAAMLTHGLTRWRFGKKKAEKFGPVLAVIGFGSMIIEATSTAPLCFREGEGYRAIEERQIGLAEKWSLCVEGDDEACQQAMSEPQRLHQLELERRTLLGCKFTIWPREHAQDQ